LSDPSRFSFYERCSVSADAGDAAIMVAAGAADTGEAAASVAVDSEGEGLAASAAGVPAAVVPVAGG